MITNDIRRILICTDTECNCKNSKKILDELQNKYKDEQVIIKAYSCIGACGLAPVALIENKVLGKITLEKILNYIEK